MDLETIELWLKFALTSAGVVVIAWLGVLLLRTWSFVPPPKILRHRRQPRWEEIEDDEGDAPFLPERKHAREEFLVKRACLCGYERKDATREPSLGGGLCPSCGDWTLVSRTVCKVKWPENVLWRK